METFQRWTVLFKRADRDVESDKWLIAEYYDSLGHLSPEGLTMLTKRLKEKHTFFPTIAECLSVITPAGRYDWGHPFLNAPKMFQAPASAPRLDYRNAAATMIEAGNDVP